MVVQYCVVLIALCNHYRMPREATEEVVHRGQSVTITRSDLYSIYSLLVALVLVLHAKLENIVCILRLVHGPLSN